MPKLRLALLFGGRSPEHSVSCLSAASVLAAIDRDRYEVIAVGIARDGRWVLAADDPAMLEVTGRELPSVSTANATVVTLPGDPTVRGLVELSATDAPSVLGRVDVVFPLLHGPFGEDGTIQGLLEMAGVPYVGSGVFASAASMDKGHMKAMLRAAGLSVGPYVVLTDAEWLRDENDALTRCESLSLPLFVKPASGGSSIGITKVEDRRELRGAILHAREHDRKVIVEAGVAGRELECGVLERFDPVRGAGAEASLPAEIRMLEADAFYDFESKYLDDATEISVPADLPEAVTKEVQRLALEAFEALDCAGIARVDFFLTPGGDLLVNEINTMPGFTPVSMYPKMWAATGVDYPALIDCLIETALAQRT